MTHTKESIQELLATNDKAVCRAVVAIYKRQTASEQRAKDTQVENGIGFNAADARYLSAVAEEIIAWEYLTPKNLFDSRQRIMKYSGQLLQIAAENESNKLLQQLSL